VQEQHVRTEFHMTENVHLSMPPFDIFQTEPDGGVLWRGSAATIEEAKARIRDFAISAPGQYIILTRQTGSKVVVHSGDVAL
jgi:hypothetical protein